MEKTKKQIQINNFLKVFFVLDKKEAKTRWCHHSFMALLRSEACSGAVPAGGAADGDCWVFLSLSLGSPSLSLLLSLSFRSRSRSQVRSLGCSAAMSVESFFSFFPRCLVSIRSPPQKFTFQGEREREKYDFDSWKSSHLQEMHVIYTNVVKCTWKRIRTVSVSRSICMRR